jgi:hypothetical protein
MNNISLKKISSSVCLGMVLIFMVPSSVFGASIRIDAPGRALSNGQPIVVHIVLDPEQNTLSGISGNFSFPSSLFTIADISNNSSVVPLWILQPSLSQEKYLDNRTHIAFEGIFPGGFDGVRDTSSQNKKEGIVFSVTLLPTAQGVGSFIVDDLLLTSFSQDASPVPVTNAISYISVPSVSGNTIPAPTALTRIKRDTLYATVSHDPLIDANAWYVMVHDSHERSAIDGVYVAETDDYNGELVAESAWRVAKNPYVLLYQERNKFINIKIIYADHTYTTLTLPPVENSHHISQLSRILISIIIVLSVLYVYGKSSFTFFKNYRKKHSRTSS